MYMARKGEEEMVNNRYGDGKAWVRGSMIGEGGFGHVFLATLRNPTIPHPFFPPLMAVKSSEVSSSESVQYEGEIYSKIGECPYLIEYYGEETTSGHNGTMAYNLMLEYASGGTLADRIEESGEKGLDEVEARLHTRSILRGLRHIHNHGYVHCDLKPHNILLVPYSDGLRAKIGDLGLAKKVMSQRRKRKLGFGWEGTAMYLSPEAATDCVQESPSDVWAVGCIVFEMLTGESPLEGMMMQTESGALEVLKRIGEGRGTVELPKELSKKAKTFLEACFMRNPKFRLTCEMLLLHPFLDGLDDDDEESESECVDDEESESESVDDDEISSYAECSSVDGSQSHEDDDDCFSSWSEEEWSSRSSDESDDEYQKAAKRVKVVDAVRLINYPVNFIIREGV